MSRRYELRVEGKNDLYVISNLLERHGIDNNRQTRIFDIVAQESLEGLLEAMPLAIKQSINRPIGFVVDADDDVHARWTAIRDRLLKLGAEAPQVIPADGLIVDIPEYKTTVGIWLMPDNQSTGRLEDFLTTLIDANDGLISHARESTEQAVERGASFPTSAFDKAVISAWLAWQHKPGLPYGSAITAHYFRHDSPAALAFVTWFKKLFEISG